MENQAKRTLIGVIAAIIIVVALAVIGFQWNKAQKERQSVLPTERPAWFGGGAPTSTPAPSTSGQ